MEGSRGLFDRLRILRRQPAPSASLSPPPIHADHVYRGLFLRTGYPSHRARQSRERKKGFCKSVVSNRSADVQKLFSVKRDHYEKSKYKNKLQTMQIN